VVVGTGETFQIWEPRRWREEASRDVDSGMAETLAGLGL
jgi:DNA-binding transcriptional regulator/RsmH inhibitor MraZ